MKKFRTLLTFLLALALVFSLASCVKVEGGDETTEALTEAEKNYTADELFNLIDQKMDTYDSYESTIKVTMNMKINGIEVKSEGEGIDIRTGQTSGNEEFYTEMQTTVSYTGMASAQKVTNIEAYYGGNYFVSSRGDGVDKKFYSPMPKEDAKEYSADDETDFFEFGDCVNKEILRNEDGSYELIFSGYTAKSVSEILDEMELDTDMLGGEIIDVVFNIKADAELNATSIEFRFEFKKDASGYTPELSMFGTFSKFNEAVIDATPIDPEKYTKVDDIRLIEDIEKLLEERFAKEEGSFTLDISQTLQFMGETQQSAETDVVVYGNNADGYFYDIDADMAGTKYDISYSKGVQTVAVDGQTQQAAQTEAEARAFIEGLMNSAQFDTNSVTDMKKISDNKYEFTCKPTAAYKALIEQMGATFRSVTQTITVTVENGAVVRIDSEAKAAGAVTQGNNTFQLTFTVDSDVTFDK